jgi:hypothetical protein
MLCTFSSFSIVIFVLSKVLSYLSYYISYKNLLMVLGMAILFRSDPTRPDPYGYSPPIRGDGAVTGYINCPDTRGGAVTDFI